MALAASAAGTVVSMSAAEDQEDIANDNARTISVQAGQEQDAANAEADRIRKNARQQQGQANAALAASGVSVDEGSAIKINEQIIKDSESDALNTIINGGRRSNYMGTQAEMERQRGVNARKAANTQAITSALSMGSSLMTASGWRSNGQPGYSGTQARAPVYDRSIRLNN